MCICHNKGAKSHSLALVTPNTEIPKESLQTVPDLKRKTKKNNNKWEFEKI